MRKTAIVTGAAEGIGKAIALRLANDGCNIVLNDLLPKLVALNKFAAELNASDGSVWRPSR